MKIKEFLKNCRYCHHVYFEIERPGDSQKEVHEVENREIYTKDDFNKFINDYGNEEFDDWFFENIEDDAVITFCLKSE